MQAKDKDGWCSIRPSLHDPIISMTFESELKGGIKAMVKVLCEQGGLTDMVEPGLLDWSPMKQYLQE